MRINQQSFDVRDSYAKYFCERFTELFGRELSSIEKNIIESSTFCISMMTTEAVGGSLQVAESVDSAMETFKFLEEQTLKYFEEIKFELLEEAKKNGISVSVGLSDNLLSIEREILEKL